MTKKRKFVKRFEYQEVDVKAWLFTLFGMYLIAIPMSFILLFGYDLISWYLRLWFSPGIIWLILFIIANLRAKEEYYEEVTP